MFAKSRSNSVLTASKYGQLKLTTKFVKPVIVTRSQSLKKEIEKPKFQKQNLSEIKQESESSASSPLPKIEAREIQTLKDKLIASEK